jgi:hypothetical protein
MKTLHTKTSTLIIDEHGIFHKTVVEDCHVDLEAVHEADRLMQELTGGNKVLMLYDARPHFTITEDAMEYSRKDIFNKQRIATAIISDKIAIKIMVDYFMNTLKSPVPIKVFSSKEDALEWLLSFKEQEKSETEHLISNT